MNKKFLTFFLLFVSVLVFSAYINWFPSVQEEPYLFETVLGKKGSGDGEFSGPIGIAISENKIFVSDSGNNRIAVFDLNGTFIKSFGTQGNEMGHLNRPMHITISGGKLYVADFGNDRIQLFNLDGKPLKSIGKSGSNQGELDAPAGVAVDTTGKIYVADFYNQRIQVLDADGNFIRQIGKTKSKGIWSGEFNYPTDVEVLANGNIVVADAYNDRIQVFNSDGVAINSWGGPFALNISGSFNGWFKTATGVAVDVKSGEIFVADFYNDRIQKFTLSGKFLNSIGGQKLIDGLHLDRPTDIAVYKNGSLYVVDYGNNRIVKQIRLKF